MKEQILLGGLLGDASIEKLSSRRKTYSIRWEHCLEQWQYALWKAENSLDNYSTYQRSRLDSRTGNTYHSITYYSTKDNYQEYRELFYGEEKQVSQIVLDRLEPLGIAVWFMDDGSMYYNGNNCHLILSVNGFNEESRDRIITYFSTKYGINFKKTVGGAIRITSKRECELFMNIVEEHIHEEMKYKTLSNTLLKYKNSLTEEQLKRRWKKNR